MKIEVGKWYWLTGHTTGSGDNGARVVKVLAIPTIEVGGQVVVIAQIRYGDKHDQARAYPEKCFVAEVAPVDIPDDRPWWQRWLWPRGSTLTKENT